VSNKEGGTHRLGWDLAGNCKKRVGKKGVFSVLNSQRRKILGTGQGREFEQKRKDLGNGGVLGVKN